MFLFQSEAFGALLHTGDCRLTPDALAGLRAHLAAADVAPLDALWLDATHAGEVHVPVSESV